MKILQSIDSKQDILVIAISNIFINLSCKLITRVQAQKRLCDTKPFDYVKFTLFLLSKVIYFF